MTHGMAQIFITKNNLMAQKKSLDLAKLGYDLMDRIYSCVK